VTITGAGEPQQIVALRTSGALFPLLGARAHLGRPLTDADDAANAPNIAVLSDRIWQRSFQSDPAVLGRAINVGDQAFTVVGVMPPEFEFASPNIEMWLPLRLTPTSTNALQIVARLKDGVSAGQAHSAMAIVARQITELDPQQKTGLQIKVTTWRETVERQYELTLVFILAAVGLVLLIACADVGGLLLSRAVQRQREIAIRTALGAGFWRVARQLLAESLVLAVLGSVAGLAAARYTLDLLSRQLAALPIMLPHLQRVALNGRVVAFSAASCVALACLCSLAPVLFASRADLQSPLGGGRAAGPRGSGRLFAILIAAETAFAFLLLVGSGLMIRSLVRLQQADHGFHPDHVLTMRVPVGTLTQTRPAGKYDTKPRQMAYYRAIAERLQSIPGVRAIAVVNNLPLSEPLLNSARTISPRYFEAMGIPLLAGRAFTNADQNGAPEVAIVNEYLAHQLFPNVDPVGQLLPSADGVHSTIVGVVKDSSQMSYEQPAKGEVYLPYQQVMFGTFMSTIVVRTAGEPLALAATLRKEVWAVDPNQPVFKVATMDDIIAESIWRPRFSAWVFSALGGLALLLTCAGVYAVVAYTTTLRMREVGIRVALGATPADVVAVVLRDAMMPLAVGLAISIAAALLLSRWLSGLLYEIGASDPVTYIAAAAILLAQDGRLR
jgi:putative ABC transport system permease protein